MIQKGLLAFEKMQAFDMIKQVLSYIEIYTRKSLAKLSDFTFVAQRLCLILKNYIDGSSIHHEETVLKKELEAILRF